MAATLEQIRAALAAALDGVPGCQVSAYVLANPTPPILMVFPDVSDGIEYHQAMGNGVERWAMRVQGLVSNTLDVGSQKKLDLWLAPSGAGSVKAAIETDKTLGGVVQQAVVRRAAGYQEYARQGLSSTVLAAEWTVDVYP
jgi:hypothetical protein